MNNAPTRVIRLDISYDGTEFGGWQQQANARTVQECLEQALEKLCGRHIAIVGAGRTDSGVHALGQVASFPFEGTMPLSAFKHGLHTFLPNDVRIVDATEIPIIDEERPFNARRDAVSKVYEYYLLLGEAFSPILSRYSWRLEHEMNMDNARQALRHFVGQHDFSSFCAANSDATSMERKIFEADLTDITAPHPLFERHRLYRVRLVGSGFLKQMVRNIVGTVVDVACGKLEAEAMPQILAARDRRKAGPTAPPHGLFLIKVSY